MQAKVGCRSALGVDVIVDEGFGLLELFLRDLNGVLLNIRWE